MQSLTISEIPIQVASSSLSRAWRSFAATRIFSNQPHARHCTTGCWFDLIGGSMPSDSLQEAVCHTQQCAVPCIEPQGGTKTGWFALGCWQLSVCLSVSQSVSQSVTKGTQQGYTFSHQTCTFHSVPVQSIT